LNRSKQSTALGGLKGRSSISCTRPLCAGCRLSSVQPTASEPIRQEDAERRQLTVMFTDLVGSTALSTKLDPEDMRSVFGAYHKCVAETVARFDGFVAKYMGDGVHLFRLSSTSTRTMLSERCGPLAIVYLNNVSALLNVCSTPHASGMPTNPQASASCSTVVPPSC